MTTFPLTLAVTPNAVQVKPGASAQITVTITNVSDIVEHYQVTLVGLPSNEYWAAEPAMTKLRPRESGAIAVRITVPERGGLLGGRYVLGVLVSSPYQPEVARSADLVLEVGVVSGMQLTATPMTAYGKTEAGYAVSLTNDGNIDVPVDLVAADDLGKAQIVITPPSVYVRPGGAQAAQVSVRAPGLITGKERRSTISIKAQALGETRGQVQVSFIQTPMIAPVVFRTLGIVLAVAVVAGAIVIGGLLGRAAPAEDAPSASSPPPSPVNSQTSQGASTPPAKPTVSPITISPSAPVVGQDTVLSATASPGITTWLWEIDGPVSIKRDTPQQAIVQFPEPGAYTVKLTVQDAGGQKVEAAELAVEVTAENSGVGVVTTPVEVGAGQTVSNAAPCAENQVAIGGGLDVVSDGAVPPPTVLQSSFGTGSGDALNQWTATVANPSTNKVDAAIKAVCIEEPDGYEVITNTDQVVNPGSSAAQPVSCPAGKVVLGGGGGIRSDTVMDTQSELEESMPIQDAVGNWTGWQVRARNLGGSPQPLSVQAICADEPDGYEVVEEPETVLAGDDEPVERRPTCPDDAFAMSGGIGVTEEIPRDPSTRTVLRESTVQAGQSAGTEQWASHLEFSAPVDQLVTGFAVCAEPPG